LEIFDAVRTSVRRRRVVPLDYESASEESNFKSTMTAMGCSLLLVLMGLFFAMPLVPGLKYVFLPLLILFLGLQLFRWVVPKKEPIGRAESSRPTTLQSASLEESAHPTEETDNR
jgi:hypothetical protein